MKHLFLPFLILGVLLTSCGGKTMRAVLVLNQPTDKRVKQTWNGDQIQKDFEVFLQRSLNQKVELTRINTNGIFETIADNPGLFLSGVIQTDKEFGFLTVIQAEYSEEQSNVVYQMVFATSAASLNRKKFFAQPLTRINKAFEYADNLFKDHKLEMSNVIFIWNTVGVDSFSWDWNEGEKKVNLSDLMEYETYEELIHLKGVFVLLEKVPGVLASEKVPLSEVLSNEMFYPNRNKLGISLYKYFEEAGLTNFFETINTNSIPMKLHFGEYISTGRKFIYVLLGPVQEGKFPDVVKQLETSGIRVYSDPVYTYDFE